VVTAGWDWRGMGEDNTRTPLVGGRMSGGIPKLNMLPDYSSEVKSPTGRVNVALAGVSTKMLAVL
jgi:hypothetical protein